MKFEDLKAMDFGPKTPEEEIIFAEEAARVDREVAEYQGTWRCRYNVTKERLRRWYHRQVDEKPWVHSIDRWFYLRARSIKLLYQRLTRGWDDSVTWNLDSHLAEVILPRLKRFKELNTHAYPGRFPGSDRPDAVETFEEWHQVLDKMIFAFEWHCDEERKYGKFDEAEYERVKEGLQLFAIFYGALWD